MSLPPLIIKIGADTVDLTEGVNDVARSMNELDATSRKVGKSLQDFGGKMQSWGKSLSVISAGIAAAGAATFGLVRSSSNAGNAIDKGAKAAGLSATAFQELGFAIGQVSDLTDQQVGKAFEQLNRRLGQAASGSQPLIDAFARIGVSQEDIQSGAVDAEGAFARLTDHLQGVASPTEAAALAAQFFGEEAGKLGPILRENGADIDILRRSAHDLGVVMSGEAVQASAEFADKMDEVSRQFIMLKNDIGTVLIPAMMSFMSVVQEKIIPGMQKIGDVIGGVIGWFQELPGPVQEVGSIIATVFAVGGPALVAIGKAISIIGSLAALIGPQGAIVLAIVALGALWYRFGDDIREGIGGAIEWATQTFREWVDYLRGLPAEFLQIATDIIEGFRDGIVNKFAEIKDGLMAPFREFGQGVRDFFGIQSPSRMFQEIGGYIGEGLAMGIQSTAGMVNAAMGAVTGGVTGQADNMVSSVLGSLGQLFKGSKVFAIAQALINTWLGATEALKLPFPANIAAFAKTLATGLGAVANIRGTNPGGGGGGGSGATAGATSAQQPTQVIRLDLQGDVIGRAGVGELFDQINSGLRQGYRLDRIELA